MHTLKIIGMVLLGMLGAFMFLAAEPLSYLLLSLF